MRKLFVIALLVALIPFTTGCRVGGLWGYDDDSGSNIGGTAAVAVAKNTVTLTQNVTLASSAVRLANVLWSDIPLILGAGTNAITIYPASYSKDANGNIVLKYQKDITVASLTAAVPTYSDTNKAVAFTVVYAGINISGSINLDNRTTDTTAATTVNITISGSPTTGFTVTVTSSTGPTGASSTGATVTTTTVTTAQLSNTFSLEKVSFGAYTLGMSATTDVVTVNTLAPKFTVTFNSTSNYTAATTWTAKVTNVTSGNSFTLSNTTDSALFTVASATNADNQGTIDITVGTATGKALKAGQTYMVEFTATNLKNASGSASLGVPAVRYFKTYTGTTVPTVLNSFTVANALTTPVVTLNFSANLKAGQTYSGAVTLERYADANYTTKEATMTIDQTAATFNATNADLTITFNQAFVANKYYKVLPSTGSIKDLNDATVTFPAYLTFMAK